MVPSTPLLDIKLYPILFNLDIVARTTFSFIALLLISLVSPTAILFNVSAGDIFFDNYRINIFHYICLLFYFSLCLRTLLFSNFVDIVVY